MPVLSLLALGAKAAGKTTFNKLLSDTLLNLKKNANSLMSKRQIDQAITRFYAHISKVRQVKTLWQVDKSVDLGTFYCESHVQIGALRKRITSFADLSTYGNLVIEGIAGQGKSIFLRYLCSVELVRSEYIPVFIELRRLRREVSLLEHIRMTLEEFGLKATTEQVEALINSGRVLLLLDAFDEVNEEDKLWLISEVEHLAKCHQDALRIVITSRPQSGIQASAIFQVVKLSDLIEDEYQTVIFKLLEDTSTASDLIKRVQSHGGAMMELLKTPLLVTLLVVNYKASQEIPEQLSDFYEALFKLLLQRHDGTKPGYRRQRLCKLNDSEYRRVFEALCFFINKHRQGPLNHDSIITATFEALNAVRISEDAENYLTDIIKITCLIVKDGEEHRFIHKSVQEYYAACYIKSKPDVVVKKIYERMFSMEAFSWNHELEFLSEIDSYRLQKYGILPAICRHLNIKIQDLNKVTPVELKQVLSAQIGAGAVILTPTSAHAQPDTICIVNFIPCLYTEYVSPLYNIDFTPILKAASSQALPSSPWNKLGKDQKEGFEVRFKDIHESKIIDTEFCDALLHIASNLINVAKQCAAQIEMEEKDEISLKTLMD
jgi:hypothetical protein